MNNTLQLRGQVACVHDPMPTIAWTNASGQTSANPKSHSSKLLLACRAPCFQPHGGLARGTGGLTAASIVKCTKTEGLPTLRFHFVLSPQRCRKQLTDRPTKIQLYDPVFRFRIGGVSKKHRIVELDSLFENIKFYFFSASPTLRSRAF